MGYEIFGLFLVSMGYELFCFLFLWMVSGRREHGGPLVKTLEIASQQGNFSPAVLKTYACNNITDMLPCLLLALELAGNFEAFLVVVVFALLNWRLIMIPLV